MEYLYKAMILGDIGTGKTAWLKRIVHNFFTERYKSTVGVDFALYVKTMDNGDFHRIQLWDIAGQERFGNMMGVYCKEASVYFFVCDITRESTINAISKWLEIFKAQNDEPEKYPCYLIITKMDLYNVENNVLEEFIKTYGHNFQLIYKISSKTDKIYRADGSESELNLLMPEIIENIKTNYLIDVLGVTAKINILPESPIDPINILPESPIDPIKLPINKTREEQLVSNFYEACERLRLQLTPTNWYTAADTRLAFCYKIHDYIMTNIQARDNASSYTYSFRTHNSNIEIIDSVVKMLENKSFTCALNDNNMTVIW